MSLIQQLVCVRSLHLSLKKVQIGVKASRVLLAQTKNLAFGKIEKKIIATVRKWQKCTDQCLFFGEEFFKSLLLTLKRKAKTANVVHMKTARKFR